MKSKECAKNSAEPAKQTDAPTCGGEKKEEEKGKKVLTRGKGFGILTKLSGRETAPGKRKRKNLLTAGKKCGNLNELPQYGADRAPKTF